MTYKFNFSKFEIQKVEHFELSRETLVEKILNAITIQIFNPRTLSLFKTQKMSIQCLANGLK